MAAARPLSLADAIAVAKSQRTEGAVARLEVKSAEVEVFRAVMQRAHLTVESSYAEGYQRVNVGAPAATCAALPGVCNANVHQQLATGTAALTVPIWSGMAVEASLSRAGSLVDAAIASEQVASRSVGLEAANAYWAVRRAEMLVTTTDQALVRKADVVAIAKARVGAGVTAGVDALRARSALLAEEARLIELRSQADEARALLSLALQIEDDVILTDVPRESVPPPPPLEDLLREAERQRPELRVAQANQEVQEAQARVTAGAFWPQLSAFANAEVRNELLGVPQTRLIASAAVGLRVDWQLFDSFSTFNTYRQDRFAVQRLAEQKRRLRRLVRTEVQTAFLRLDSANKRTAPLTEAVRIARAEVDAVKRRYQAGAALMLEVLDAESVLQQAEVACVNNSIDVALFDAALSAARGLL